MVRKLVVALGVLACGVLAIGCDSTSSAAKKAGNAASGAASQAADAAKDAAKDAKEAASDAASKAADAAKTAIIEPIKAMMPKIEEKLKGLSGETLTKAKEKYDALKKLVEEFTAAPGDKTRDLGEKLKAAFEELKKLIGL